MNKVTIAAGTRIAADAGAAVAAQGGNAVDAAIAAMVVSVCTDTGIMSPGCGAFVTIWPAEGDPVVIDGYAEMPGRG
ncbi:MAG: gamma-glutamyltransferase, partial [Gammaproteobacteria bacterium]|nr:gamma-glutamyltransferase [Gammaproteobacteria bacterium]